MASSSISSMKDGGVQWITLERPEKRNALTVDMTAALVAELDRIGGDESVGCVIITGAGSAFCSGRDVHELSERLTDSNERQSMPGAAGLLPKALLRLPQIAIAMINGPALGEGLDLALMCDLAVASTDAVLGDLHIARGVVPSTGCWNLPRLIGLKRAAEMLLLGRRVGGVEAHELGLVNRAVPADLLRAETAQLAQELLSMPPTALRLTKRAMQMAVTAPLDHTLEFVTFARSVAAKTGEVAGRVDSFLAG